MADDEPGRDMGWRLLSVIVVCLGLACAGLSAAAAVHQSGGAGSPQHPSPCTAYVVNSFSDSVTPIPTATNRAGRPIPVGALPVAVAVTPDGSRAYVVDEGTPGAITPIRTASNTAGRSIRVAGTPEAIVITPDGATAYVADENGLVVPVSLATGTPGTPINTGPVNSSGGPYRLAITPDGKTVYVADQAKGTVTPISTTTGIAGHPVKVGRDPVDMAVTPNGKTLYVVDGGSGTVTPVHTATNAAGHVIRIGKGAYSIVVRPTGKSAYVLNRVAGSVTRIPTATNRAGQPVELGPGPALMAVTPDGRKAYVLHPARYGTRRLLDTVTPLRLGTTKADKPITARKPITVGTEPAAIAITPDGRTAYVVSTSSGTVTPITTATNVAGKPITVGTQPSAVAVACRPAARSYR